MDKKYILERIRMRDLNRQLVLGILESSDGDILEELRRTASFVLRENYGDEVYIRGLIEFSNYCHENCLYCGIRAENKELKRFRLTKEEILQCAENGYELGFRTFVLQGGEDSFFKDSDFVEIISSVKRKFPDTRVTLSLGVKSYETLKSFKQGGADRYLLRHETADEMLFKKLHPENQSLEIRKKCLFDLKKLGYTVGSGFLIGAPGWSYDAYIKDIDFLKELSPEMIGIGPFIPQESTPFKDEKAGDLLTTLKFIAILRILFPEALIPSTTALNTIDENGRILGIKFGANVIMPNLSPQFARENYKLYNKKEYNNLEAAENIKILKEKLSEIGKNIVTGPGDPRGKKDGL